MIIASAPGRCGIIGNPTDMYGGSVLSCSTSELAHCELVSDTTETTIDVSGVTRRLVKSSDLELHEGDYLNVVSAVLTALEVDPAACRPFHLRAWTTIPMQAGLAGSTAILTTIVGCVLAYLEIRLQWHVIAELVRKIEHDYLGIVCGFQDHYMTTFGGINYMDFRDKISTDPQDENTVFATVEKLESYINFPPLILANTGVRHHSGAIHKPIRDRWLAGDREVIEGMEEIGHLARTGKRSLLAEDWETLGGLMNRNHEIQRALGGSAESNDRLIQAALDGGALGAKLAGAGGGGTIVALAPEPESVILALQSAGADRLYYPRSSPGLSVEVRI